MNDALNNIIDTHFSRAIRKYGENNFKLEIIDNAKTQEELTLKEQHWIKYYDSTNPKHGYNETDAIHKCGGNTYISKTNDELEEIKTKISQSKKGIKNPNATSVKCFNVNTKKELVFDTVKECRVYFGEKTHRFITTRVTGKVIGLYRNEWKIAYVDSEYGDFKPKHYRNGIKLRIKDLKTEQVTEVDSIRLASRQFNISINDINKHRRNNEDKFIIGKYEITILN